MTQRRHVVPRDENNQRDWWGMFRESWPMLVAIVLAVLWLSGRTETPEVKQQRIDATLAPVRVQLSHISDQLEAHVGEGGHQEMLQRMQTIELMVRDLWEERKTK